MADLNDYEERLLDAINNENDWKVKFVARDGAVVTNALSLIIFCRVLHEALKDKMHMPLPVIIMPDFDIATIKDILTLLHDGNVSCTEEKLNELGELIAALTMNLKQEFSIHGIMQATAMEDDRSSETEIAEDSNQNCEDDHLDVNVVDVSLDSDSSIITVDLQNGRNSIKAELEEDSEVPIQNCDDNLDFPFDSVRSNGVTTHFSHNSGSAKENHDEPTNICDENAQMCFSERDSENCVNRNLLNDASDLLTTSSDAEGSKTTELGSSQHFENSSVCAIAGNVSDVSDEDTNLSVACDSTVPVEYPESVTSDFIQMEQTLHSHIQETPQALVSQSSVLRESDDSHRVVVSPEISIAVPEIQQSKQCDLPVQVQTSENNSSHLEQTHSPASVLQDNNQRTVSFVTEFNEGQSTSLCENHPSTQVAAMEINQTANECDIPTSHPNLKISICHEEIIVSLEKESISKKEVSTNKKRLLEDTFEDFTDTETYFDSLSTPAEDTKRDVKIRKVDKQISITEQPKKKIKLDKSNSNKSHKDIQCRICPRTFKNKHLYESHNRKHFTETLDCRVCGKKFTTYPEKMEHPCKVPVKSSSYYCFVCTKQFGEKCIMLTHRQQHMQCPLECPKCFKKLPEIKSLMSHIRVHTQECNKYDTYAECSTSPPETKPSKPLVENLKCHICKTLCSSGLDKAKHGCTISNQINRYRCGLCTKSYAENCVLMVHELHHFSAPKNTECPVCKTHIPSVSRLLAHVRNHVGEDIISTTRPSGSSESNMKNYECKHCKQPYSREPSLVMHQLQHERKSQLLCPYCNKKSSDIPAATRHLEKHFGFSSDTGDRKCSLCLVCFESDLTYLSHRSQHEQKFTCPMCSALFGELSSLLDHIYLHNQEIIQKATCGKCLKNHATLGEILVHNCEKSILNCPLCSRSFGTVEKCAAHVNKHFGYIELKCALCSAAFKSPQELLSHSRKCNL